MDDRILLVDDEQGLLVMVETLLRKEGFQRIAKASSGLEALRHVQSASFELIVLAVMLPDMNGFDSARSRSASDSSFFMASFC
ncbi:response regulator [Paenibacillus terricola]|nr:response regulator [Paenibacillus terricola]